MTPLSPQPLSQYGVFEIGERGVFTVFGLRGQEPVDLIGVEYESRYSSFLHRSRELSQWFIKNKYAHSISTEHELLELIKTELFSYTSDLIQAPAHMDGGGLEIVPHPATFEAQQALKPEYERILRAFKHYGFNSNLGGDGIHLNVDKSLLGASIQEQRITLAKMLLFYYRNNTFFVRVSNRTSEDDHKVDIYHQLGDSYGNLTDDELDKVFYTEKGKLLDSLESSTVLKSLGLRMNRGGRPAIEFRWFGSTHDVDILMSQIEFIHALCVYCRTNTEQDEISLGGFCFFISDHSKSYLHLANRMLYFRESKELMNNMKVLPF